MQHMKFGIITSDELANKMEEPSGNLIIADCRSGIEFSTWHISGSVNIGGTRNTRREIMSGRVTVLSVLYDQIGRSCNKDELVVVYDQCSIEISNAQSLSGRVADELALYFRRVCFLTGGFIGFQSKFVNLCWTNKHKLPDEDFVTPSQTCSIGHNSQDSDGARLLVNSGNQSLTRSKTMIAFVSDQSNVDSSSNSCLERYPNSIKTQSFYTKHSLSGPALPPSKEGPTTVLPYLLLGTQQDALNQSCILKHGITHVINVSTDGLMCPFISPQNFIRIPVLDNFADKITPYFPKAFKFLDDVQAIGGRVLVHCSAGISRSPTLAIGYIIRTKGMAVTEAYNFVKSFRASVSPNFNFMGQLTDYELSLKSLLDDRTEESTQTKTTATSRQKRRPSRLGFLSTLLRHRISGTSPPRDTGGGTCGLSVTKTTASATLLPSPSVPFAKLGINSPMEECQSMGLRLDNFPTTSLDQLHFQPCQAGPRGVKVKRSATQSDHDSSKTRKQRLTTHHDSGLLQTLTIDQAARRHSAVFPLSQDSESSQGTRDCCLDTAPLCLSGRSVSYERITMGSSNSSALSTVTPSTNNGTGTILTDSCRLQECHQSTSSLSSANSHSSNLLV